MFTLWGQRSYTTLTVTIYFTNDCVRTICKNTMFTLVINFLFGYFLHKKIKHLLYQSFIKWNGYNDINTYISFLHRKTFIQLILIIFIKSSKHMYTNKYLSSSNGMSNKCVMSGYVYIGLPLWTQKIVSSSLR